MPVRIALFLSLVAVALGCRTARAPSSGETLSPKDLPPTSRADAAEATALGPGDLLEVRVFQEPDLSGAFRVSTEGKIDYPLCGPVTLAGLNSTQGAEALRKCLSNGFVKNPQVSILVREFNSKKVFVFGEVNKPGTFPFEERMTIVQAITVAGGFTKTAAKNATNVTRLVGGSEKKIRVPVEDIGVGKEKNFLLEPGDIVFVPESFF